MSEETTAQQYGDLPFRWGWASDKGRQRLDNEDAVWIEPEAALFVVSDGMGGHRGGELASSIVVEDLPVKIETRLHRLKRKSVRSIRRILRKTIAEQNRHVHMEGGSESGRRGMGATAAVAIVVDGRAYVANLGDSRIYRFSRKKLIQLSRDHSVVAELIEAGKVEPQEAQNHHARGQITRYMGMASKAVPHIRTFMLHHGDRLLLCTDGLTDMLDDKSIADVLASEQNGQKACDKLVHQANEAGGFDNITAVVMDWL